VIAAVQIAILANIPYIASRNAIFAHPTMAAGLLALLARVPDALGGRRT
jgi:hypothetical protein